MVWTKSPQSLIDLFDKSVPPGANISRRKMFGYPAAFANGNLFIGLHQNDFVMRLSEKDRARFSAEFGERVFEPMKGRPMREYVRLPEELLADAEKRASWIDLSLRYAEAIAPKVTSPKKKQLPRSMKRSRV
ncbi:TfoX/Sxy family protein [Bradyrhizobium sp. sGM-13]|uniref:TfoX/Sxy family protein n=1 Tax=Bradyrhizobium sp. sGM-13 TaxID=2831781 RepID=UPI001BCDEE39|nr:TfoX/Sxy family protein [Bradyrhizobium sp. sGM-13]